MVFAKNAYNSAKLNKCLKDLIKIIEKDIYSNLYTLFKVALVLPISSSKCEHSFSAIHHFKT